MLASPAPEVHANVKPSRPGVRRPLRTVVLVLTDISALIAAGIIAYLLWALPMREQPGHLYVELAPLTGLFLLGYAAAGLYPGLGLGAVETLRRLSLVTVFGFLVLAAFSFALKLPHLYSRITFALALIGALILVPLARFGLFLAARQWLWWAEPVVVIGTGRRAARAIRGIQSARQLGYRPIAVVAPDSMTQAATDVEGVPIIGGLEQAEALSAAGVRVAFLEVEQTQTRSMLDRLHQQFQHVILLREFDDLPVEGLQVRNLGSLVGIEYTNNLLRPANQSLKRLLDVALGTLAFLAGVPLILVAFGLVLLFDGYPVLYWQDRTGYLGCRIRVPKIRTMRRDADQRLADNLAADAALLKEWQTSYKLRDDPRLIPAIGRFFRRFSIDELPQLWLVVRGEMSLVGPRPFPDYHLQRFTPEFLELRQRVRPGVTGLWQISVRSDGSTVEQEAYDTHYIRNWSVWFDLYVLGRTFFSVLSGRGAY